jgi:HD-like signal output (HDOD) protein
MHTAKNIPNFSLKQLWAHSFRVSNIARLIAQCESVSENIIVQAGMAGLLHDVGKLILASSFPDKYMRVMNRVAETKKPIYNCEMEEFGSTHAQVGAYLMGLWGMSNKTIHGIGYHHQHEKFDRSVQMFVSIANTIDHQCVIIHPDYVRIGISEKLLPESKREKQLKKWIDYINNHLEGVDDMQIVNADLLKCAKKMGE